MVEKLNGGPNGSKWSAILVPALIAAISASGGLYIALGTPVGESLTRPDPFTGAQGAYLEQRIEALEYHVRNHPDVENQFDRRITTLEVQFSQIIENQRTILEHIRNNP